VPVGLSDYVRAVKSISLHARWLIPLPACAVQGGGRSVVHFPSLIESNCLVMLTNLLLQCMSFTLIRK
jgi:hypothetical protein